MLHYGDTGPGTTWATEIILVWIMPQVQDRSLNLFTCSPARYHCAPVAPERYFTDKHGKMCITYFLQILLLYTIMM